MNDVNVGLTAAQVKNILEKSLGRHNDDSLNEEAHNLHAVSAYDYDQYVTDSLKHNHNGMLDVARTVMESTGNVNAALSVINFNLTEEQLFHEFVRKIVNADGDDRSYARRWPTSEWKPYKEYLHSRNVFGQSCTDKYGHVLSDVKTYAWLLQNSKRPAEVLESLEFINVAKLAYFAGHVFCPKRFSGDIVQLCNRIIGLSSEDPDAAVTVIDVLIDPGIMASDVVIDLDDLIDKASSGLPASFLAEPLKIGSNTDDFFEDIRKTTASIENTIYSAQKTGLYIRGMNGLSVFDSPLSMPSEENQGYSTGRQQLLEFFTDYSPDSNDMDLQCSGDISKESDAAPMCMDLEPAMFSRFVHISNLLKTIPLDVWLMLDLRIDVIKPGSFRVIMPTDSLWTEDDWYRLYQYDSRETRIGNVEQIFGHGVDRAWRWMIWTRIQHDMFCIMQDRKSWNEPVFRRPMPAAHTIPPEVMSWIADGVMPKSIVYKDKKRHKVKMDLTSASDKWFFRNGFWYLPPYDILKAMPKTWDEALSCMKRNHDDSPIPIYDRALKGALRFHSPIGNPEWTPYEQYMQEHIEYQNKEEVLDDDEYDEYDDEDRYDDEW